MSIDALKPITSIPEGKKLAISSNRMTIVDKAHAKIWNLIDFVKAINFTEETLRTLSPRQCQVVDLCSILSEKALKLENSIKQLPFLEKLAVRILVLVFTQTTLSLALSHLQNTFSALQNDDPLPRDPAPAIEELPFVDEEVVHDEDVLPVFSNPASPRQNDPLSPREEEDDSDLEPEDAAVIADPLPPASHEEDEVLSEEEAPPEIERSLEESFVMVTSTPMIRNYQPEMLTFASLDAAAQEAKKNRDCYIASAANYHLPSDITAPWKANRIHNPIIILLKDAIVENWKTQQELVKRGNSISDLILTDTILCTMRLCNRLNELIIDFELEMNYYEAVSQKASSHTNDANQKEKDLHDILSNPSYFVHTANLLIAHYYLWVRSLPYYDTLSQTWKSQIKRPGLVEAEKPFYDKNSQLFNWILLWNQRVISLRSKLGAALTDEVKSSLLVIHDENGGLTPANDDFLSHYFLQNPVLPVNYYETELWPSGYTQ